MNLSKSQLEDLLLLNAKSIIRKCNSVKAGHIGGSLSLSLIALPILHHYYTEVEPSNVQLKLILSKGHASLGLYSVLNQLSIASAPFENYCNLTENSYHGHTCKSAHNIISHSTGSLGHGLPYSFGLALANSLKSISNIYVLCIIGDGELQEGTFYETMLHLASYPWLNLTIIVDNNYSIKTRTLSSDLILERLCEPYMHIINPSSYSDLIKLCNFVFTPGLKILNCKNNGYFGLHPDFQQTRWHASVPTDDEVNIMISSLSTSLLP